MIRRDNRTRWGAKGLWTESSLATSDRAAWPGATWPQRLALRWAARAGAWTLAAYKMFAGGMRAALDPRGGRRRWRRNFRLKPYWGKPAVRNFRGGGENTGGLPLVVHAVRPLSTP